MKSICGLRASCVKRSPPYGSWPKTGMYRCAPRHSSSVAHVCCGHARCAVYTPDLIRHTMGIRILAIYFHQAHKMLLCLQRRQTNRLCRKFAPSTSERESAFKYSNLLCAKEVTGNPFLN